MSYTATKDPGVQAGRGNAIKRILIAIQWERCSQNKPSIHFNPVDRRSTLWTLTWLRWMLANLISRVIGWNVLTSHPGGVEIASCLMTHSETITKRAGGMAISCLATISLDYPPFQVCILCIINCRPIRPALMTTRRVFWSFMHAKVTSFHRYFNSW